MGYLSSYNSISKHYDPPVESKQRKQVKNDLDPKNCQPVQPNSVASKEPEKRNVTSLVKAHAADDAGDASQIATSTKIQLQRR